MVASFVAYLLAASQIQEPPILKVGKPIERRIEADAVHTFTVELKKGELGHISVMQKGADVVVTAYSPSGTKIKEVDSPNGNQGEEPCEFIATETGKHRIEVKVLPENPGAGNYSITLVEVLSEKARLKRDADAAAKAAAEAKAVEKWIATKAVPIKTVEAGNGLEDLAPLKKTLKNVRIVGLGEATHGTREFFQMKHRMLEFLAKEMGFTVFGIEATYAECLKINDYVLNGTGDPAQALAGQYFWTWNTKEVLDMMQWMREYNKTAPEGKKLKFLGFDIQASKEASKNVLAYFQKVDPDRMEEVKSTIAHFYPVSFQEVQSYNTQAPDVLAKSLADINKLIDTLTANKEAYVGKSSADDYNAAFNSAHEIRSWHILNGAPNAEKLAARDTGMADMVERLLQQEPAGTKMVLWAHNAHVAKRDAWMGGNLTKKFGPKYYSIGFAFDEGSFQAINMAQGDPGPGLQEFTAPANQEGQVGWVLRQPGKDRFFIDMRSLPSKPVTEWLNAPHRGWEYGAGATKASLEAQPMMVRLNVYDGLIFIRKTTRAQPNPVDPNTRPSMYGP